eukprot:s2731_g13.t1
MPAEANLQQRFQISGASRASFAKHERDSRQKRTEHGSCLSTRALVHAMLPADPTHLEDSSAPALGFSDVSRLPKPGCKKLMLACFLAGQLSHEHSSVQCHPLSAAS